MIVSTLFESPAVTVRDYHCSAGPHDRPFSELHATACLSFVRRGSFGYRVRGELHELVAGAVLVGAEGDEYVCSHEHHPAGDECLSCHFSPETADELASGAAIWALGSTPPLVELMIGAEVLQAAANGAGALGVDEAALRFAARFAELASGRKRRPVRNDARTRRRAVETAMWIEEHAREDLRLEGLAELSGLSPYHFLRVFSSVLGVTPHQYVVRTRLRAAARLLADAERPITEVAYDVGFADLSNFVRTFRRAAGVSPGAFRRATRVERKNLQERLGARG